MKLFPTQQPTPNKNRGFTLIELIVAVAGFTLIIWGLIGLFSGIFYSSNQQANLLSDTDQARKAAFQLAFELRNGQTGSNGAYVLDTAGDQQIIFYSNIDSSPSVERVRYYTQNNQLWKGLTYYSGNSYNTSTESTFLIQRNLANGTSTPVFYYYDGSYTGSTTQISLVQPVNVTAVKFVKVNLVIYNKAGVKNTNTYTVTSSASIRNLKTNLGQ